MTIIQPFFRLQFSDAYGKHRAPRSPVERGRGRRARLSRTLINLSTPIPSQVAPALEDPAPSDPATTPRKRVKPLTPDLRAAWLRLGRAADAADRALSGAGGSGVAFAFAEGALVTSLRSGAWLLLDEANLAPPDVLERIAGLLESPSGSVLLAERGDTAPIPRHPGFRLICAMNPATDAGKKDMPPALRDRFAELWVGEPAPESADMRALVGAYLGGAVPGGPDAAGGLAEAVCRFYAAARGLAASGGAVDGGGSPPAYTLRTLCRALGYAASAAADGGGGAASLARSLRDGVAACFEAPLCPRGAATLRSLADTHLPPAAGGGAHRRPAEAAVKVGDFWLPAGPLHDPAAEAAALLPGGKGGGPPPTPLPPPFVVTPSVARSLNALARAASMRRYPILLQGPTSAGKTSLVAHLAASTGHPCVRINNHDQTDLADYLGTYRSGPSGRLEFCEGPLLTAARAGSWVLLDELNLAPSDVLEALNRLLDGNRELYVPELRATVRPAPGFMLFATQNPAGGYGGRKPLSRALRTRFLELDVGDLPDDELATVVSTRCGVPPSHAGRLVGALRALERARGGAAAGADVFAGRRALVTPRDLFRWAERRAPTYADLATAGYMLLAERLREGGEREAVARTLAKVMKADPAPGPAYEAAAAGAAARLADLLAADDGDVGDGTAASSTLAALRGLAWTPSLRRVAALALAALEAAEPVLLVGDTGSGKTTAAQLAAALRGVPLIAINCSRHTEAADFVGGFRPVR